MASEGFRAPSLKTHIPPEYGGNIVYSYMKMGK
jgi:hypothetical protein